VLFTVDSTRDVHAISPFIYGTNQGDFAAEARNLTLKRVGGNRLTAYNWETNASNAGSDYLYQSDDYISSSMVAGAPMKEDTQAAMDAAASIMLTVPMAGWVAADRNGPCPSNPTPAQIAQRFVPVVAKKPGTGFAYPPVLGDNAVYADEFVAWMESQFPMAATDPARRIFYSLDNEPDLWSGTHSEIHPDAVTFAEMATRSVEFAGAIKDAAPHALVFGPASYGFNGYVNLQNAPDQAGRDFLEFYLDTMSDAEAAAGHRLLDVLDLHWYPEAQGGGSRITDDGVGAAEVAARLQAPRSLWDSTYTEDSWIAQYMGGPIALIPMMLSKIASHYPGTGLGFTEYNYGAGGHISGGMAQADALGVFGREGVHTATVWLLSSSNAYLFAAFAMYRNFDGNNGSFGDTSVHADTSNVEQTSVFASVRSSGDGKVIVVAINKTDTARVAGIAIKHAGTLSSALVYTLTAAAASPQAQASLTAVATNAFSYSLPPMSVTTLVLGP
jgi:hypothetical protein